MRVPKSIHNVAQKYELEIVEVTYRHAGHGGTSKGFDLVRPSNKERLVKLYPANEQLYHEKVRSWAVVVNGNVRYIPIRNLENHLETINFELCPLNHMVYEDYSGRCTGCGYGY